MLSRSHPRKIVAPKFNLSYSASVMTHYFAINIRTINALAERGAMTRAWVKTVVATVKMTGM